MTWCAEVDPPHARPVIINEEGRVWNLHSLFPLRGVFSASLAVRRGRPAAHIISRLSGQSKWLWQSQEITIAWIRAHLWRDVMSASRRHRVAASGGSGGGGRVAPDWSQKASPGKRVSWFVAETTPEPALFIDCIALFFTDQCSWVKSRNTITKPKHSIRTQKII